MRRTGEQNASNVRFALAVTVLAPPAVSAVGTASAFPFWGAVAGYYIPL